MAFLYARVKTQLGEFCGYTHDKPESKENLIRTRDVLQAQLENLQTFTLFESFSNPDECQITLPSEVIRNSVVSFKILE